MTFQIIEVKKLEEEAETAVIKLAAACSIDFQEYAPIVGTLRTWLVDFHFKVPDGLTLIKKR